MDLDKSGLPNLFVTKAGESLADLGGLKLKAEGNEEEKMEEEGGIMVADEEEGVFPQRTSILTVGGAPPEVAAEERRWKSLPSLSCLEVQLAGFTIIFTLSLPPEY